MIPFWFALAAMLPTSGVDLLIPAPNSPARLRVLVTVDGRAPVVAWTAFLDKLFDHFDREGNGTLTAIEAGRVFPLPLPGGGEIKSMNVAATRSQFREHYRKAGFAPIVAVVRPPTGEQLRLSDALFRYLDRDGDGKLSRAELGKVPELLRRFDLNEDESLEPSELLASEKTDMPAVAKSRVSSEPSSGICDGLLRIAIGKLPAPAKFVSWSSLFTPAEDVRSLSFPKGRLTVQESESGAKDDFSTAKEFYLAQFGEALGKKPALTKATLEADSDLQAIAAMFDSADRDGDGKLTSAELSAFLDLIELGVHCQAFVIVEDRGANLFDLIDTDGDGRLDVAELTRAAKLHELERTKIPTHYLIGVSKGPVGTFFGPVPIPISASKPAPKAIAKGGPAWFRALDGNGDGFVSAAEFRGTPEQFKKWDLDCDGRINVAEAKAAGR